MSAQTSGAIVNIASHAGLRAGGGIAYTAAKAGLIGLTKALAFEYGRAGIRANAVAPGHVHTPIGDRVHGLGPGPESRAAAARWGGSARHGGHGLGRGVRRALPRKRRGALGHGGHDSCRRRNDRGHADRDVSVHERGGRLALDPLPNIDAYDIKRNRKTKHGRRRWWPTRRSDMNVLISPRRATVWTAAMLTIAVLALAFVVGLATSSDASAASRPLRPTASKS